MLSVVTKLGTTLSPVVTKLEKEEMHMQMISEEEIREWWERKIDNYIKNYARQNKMSLM